MGPDRRGPDAEYAEARRRARPGRATGLVEQLPEALLVVGSDETLLCVNRAAEELTGYTAAELLGGSVGLVLGEADPFMVRGVAALSGKDALRTLVHRDGRHLPVRWSGRVLENSGEFATGATVCVVRNAADSVEEVEGLRAELRRAAVLLEEVRHRSGNQLQVAASLIGLRARHAESRGAREALEDCGRSLEALVLVHERLRGEDALERLDLAGTLTELASTLLPGGRSVLKLEPVLVDAAQAAPLGLVFVELVSNAVQHAHADGSEPLVRVSLERAAGGRRRLTVADDGCGLPVGFDPTQSPESEGLGLVLVRQLVRQIGGSVRWRSADGAVVEVEFPVAGADPVADTDLEGPSDFGERVA